MTLGWPQRLAQAVSRRLRQTHSLVGCGYVQSLLNPQPSAVCCRCLSVPLCGVMETSQFANPKAAFPLRSTDISSALACALCSPYITAVAQELCSDPGYRTRGGAGVL